MKTNEIEMALDGAANVFEAKGLVNIRNCLSMIAATRVGTVPLYRPFGTEWEWVDRPLPYAMAKYRADLIEAIGKWEPRVRVTSISFRADNPAAMDGKLIPVVRFKLREGVSL